MLTKPRTVWGGQPVAFIISANDAPLARFIKAITSAFLLVRSVFAPAVLLVRPGFFCALAFLVGLRSPFGCAAAARTPRCSQIRLWSFRFSFAASFAVVIIHHSDRQKQQAEFAATTCWRVQLIKWKRAIGGLVSFL